MPGPERTAGLGTGSRTPRGLCLAHLSCLDFQHLKAGKHGLAERLQPTMKVGDG
jgi:hypothetical protein